MGRPRTFPAELYVTVEQEGAGDEYLQTHPTLESAASLEKELRVGRYMLHEVITIGTKVVVKNTATR